MKKFFALLIAFLFSITATAQNWDTVVIVGGAIGTVVSSQYAIYQSLVKRELKGWAQRETGTSVKLENQCGIETEFHLIGDYKRNYIMIGISNNSGEQVALNFRRVKFVVNHEMDRFPGYSYQVSDELVNNGWWILASIPLPKKSEFASYNHFTVEIPVVRAGEKNPCMIVTEFSRTGHFEKEDVGYNVFDFMFDLGPSLGQMGNVNKLGDPGFIWAMDFNWFFSGNHGAGMAFQWESGFHARNTSASIFSGDFHYVHRSLVTPRLSLNFEPGVGFQGLSTNYNSCHNCHYHNYNYDNTFMLDYRLMLQYNVGQWDIVDVNVMNYFIGGGVVQQYGFSGETNGSRFGLLFRMGLGF